MRFIDPTGKDGEEIAGIAFGVALASPIPVVDELIAGAILLGFFVHGGAKKIDPKTVQDSREKFKNQKDPKLTKQQGDKNRPPDLNPKKKNVPWWAALLRLISQADDALPAENETDQQDKNEQQQAESDQDRQQDVDGQNQQQDERDQNQTQQDDENED